MNWTRLSCHQFVANQVRPQLAILAYNLGDFLRRLALRDVMRGWSLSSLQVKLIKIGAKMVRHDWRIVFQLAEVELPRGFAALLQRIDRLRCAYS